MNAPLSPIYRIRPQLYYPKLLENSLSSYWLLVSRAESVMMQLAKVGDMSDANFTHTTPHTTVRQCVKTLRQVHRLLL
jgi:hypothetical protein